MNRHEQDIPPPTNSGRTVQGAIAREQQTSVEPQNSRRSMKQSTASGAVGGCPGHLARSPTVHHVFDGLHHAESERIVSVVDQMDLVAEWLRGTTDSVARPVRCGGPDLRPRLPERRDLQHPVRRRRALPTLLSDTSKPALLALVKGLDDARSASAVRVRRASVTGVRWM